MKTNRRTFLTGVSTAAVFSGSRVAFAQKKYSDGASDTEIKIGQTMPYSGPASIYNTIGKAEAAYIAKINAEVRGIGQRKGRRVAALSIMCIRISCSRRA